MSCKISSLSVVIPVFNEEHVIRESLLALSENLRSVCADHEIVVVDDGSTDGTAPILKDLSRTIPCLNVVRHAVNKGLGAAMRSGFDGTSKDLVFYTDADMPFKYSEILQAASRMGSSGADMVIGFRVNRKLESPVRRLCSMGYNGCVRVIYGVRFRDINCAFKLVRQEALRRLGLKANGSFIDAEMLAKASNLGLKIEEFGVEYHPRQEGDSRLFRLCPIVNAFMDMARLYMDIRRMKKTGGRV